MPKQSMRKLRKSWGYEPRAPRCELCKFFQQGRAVTISGVIHQGLPICKSGLFNILPGGLCDRFVDRTTSETLDLEITD